MQQTQCKIGMGWGGGGGFACPNRGFIWVVDIYLVLMKPSPRADDSVNFVFVFRSIWNHINKNNLLTTLTEPKVMLYQNLL